MRKGGEAEGKSEKAENLLEVFCKELTIGGSYIINPKVNGVKMLRLGHKKLEVWRKSIALVKEVYQLTEKFPKEEKYGLISQMRRAAVSISSNLSEGAARSSQKERKRFYEISRSSLVEIDTQLEISLILNFTNKEQLSVISKLMNEIFAMITAMKANT